MGIIDRSDDRTFNTNFTANGETALKEKLNEKLKEFMGDHTDEILVDYVIVLLKNGKGKNQAKNDLNLFLGDESDSFVSWLWDHLALNIDSYVQPKGLQDEAPKSKHLSKVQAEDDGFKNLNSKSERVKSRSRRNKDWNGLVGGDTEAPPLLSFVVDNMHLDEKAQSKVNRGPRPPSSAPPVQKKRGCAVEQQETRKRVSSVEQQETRKRVCSIEQQKTRKRGCAVEQQKTKRDSVSQVTIDAPRRLLQFAVRDAVAASMSSNLGTPVEPSLKRLRAVVSSSHVESSMVEHPHSMQTISRVENPMVKFKSSGSAFDPIDCDTYPSYGNVQLEDNQYQEESPFLYHEKTDYGDQYAANMMLDHETGFQFEDNQYQEESPFLYHEENDYGDQYAVNMTMLDHETGFQFEDNQYQEESPFSYHEQNDYGDQYAANMTMLDHETGFQFEDNQYQEENPFLYHEKNDYGDQYAANMTMLDHEIGVPSDSSSDNEGFDDVNFMGNRVGRVSQLSSGEKRGEDSLMGNYSVAKNDDSMLLKKNRNREQSAAAPNSSKIVNISVNVNAWNPPVPKQYAKPRKVAELSGHKTLNSGTRAPRSGLCMVNENAKTAKIDNGKAKPTLDLLKVTQKAQPSTPGTGSSAASCSLDDADSRTIFASNVHFAATKDAICRHFNKFGEVLKTAIVTDSITGKPKGAAYVEFMHKEAADNALSLDGTSFMSRILKVVTKSTAQQQDYAPAAPWPCRVRGSPYPSARFLRAPTPTGIAGAFRPAPPVRFGARSLQWKRAAQGTSSDNGATLNNSSISAPVSRGLTYIRSESKLDGSSSTTQFNSSKNGR